MSPSNAHMISTFCELTSWCSSCCLGPSYRMLATHSNSGTLATPQRMIGRAISCHCLPRSIVLRTGLLAVSPLRPAARAVAAMAAQDGAKKVLVPIGTGTEEMEAVITIDVLRRAGAAVTVASVEDQLQVTCSRGVKIVADQLITDAAGQKFDLIACPGGMPGAERLRDSTILNELVKQQQAAGELYAAICATPAVFFESQGILQGRKATAHPAFSGKLSNQAAVAERVVVDGSLTTSRGPGTAFEFALSLVKQLYGEEKMKEVAGPMVMYNFKV